MQKAPREYITGQIQYAADVHAEALAVMGRPPKELVGHHAKFGERLFTIEQVAEIGDEWFRLHLKPNK